MKIGKHLLDGTKGDDWERMKTHMNRQHTSEDTTLNQRITRQTMNMSLHNFPEGLLWLKRLR